MNSRKIKSLEAKKTRTYNALTLGLKTLSPEQFRKLTVELDRINAELVSLGAGPASR